MLTLSENSLLELVIVQIQKEHWQWQQPGQSIPAFLSRYLILLLSIGSVQSKQGQFWFQKTSSSLRDTSHWGSVSPWVVRASSVLAMASTPRIWSRGWRGRRLSGDDQRHMILIDQQEFSKCQKLTPPKTT